MTTADHCTGLKRGNGDDEGTAPAYGSAGFGIRSAAGPAGSAADSEQPEYHNCVTQLQLLLEVSLLLLLLLLEVSLLSLCGTMCQGCVSAGTCGCVSAGTCGCCATTCSCWNSASVIGDINEAAVKCAINVLGTRCYTHKQLLWTHAQALTRALADATMLERPCITSLHQLSVVIHIFPKTSYNCHA